VKKVGGLSKYILLLLVMLLLFSSLFGQDGVMAGTNAVNISAFDNFSSTSYILMDFSSGKPLINFNEREKMPVASICKLMTSLITIEKLEKGELNLYDKMLVSEYAAGVEGSQAFLDAGQEYTVADLLKSVIVASANDSAIVLAEGIAGSEQVFVELMNNRAKELGMLDTNYTNATGLTTPNQYSTAYDTGLILREINKYERYGNYAKIWMDKLIHPSGRVTELVNTNRLIKYYTPCLDGKTGFTDEAGYCLSSVAEKDGLKLIAVTLNCKDAGSRFSESIKLYDYGFANYKNNVVLAKDLYIDTIDTNMAKQSEARIGITKDLAYVCEKTLDKNYELVYNLPETIPAPMSMGDKIGTVEVLVDGEVIDFADIILLDNIDKHNIFAVFDKIFNNWVM